VSNASPGQESGPESGSDAVPRSGPGSGPPRSARLLLGLAAIAVAFAAADTYVVVLSLPDMMGSVGLSVDELQRAAPIVSGFLLGYVAMLPLIGRIADLRGRTPVLVAALVVFAFGSLVTAAAYDLGSLVTGRFLQGVGGGGLVPVTLALVADLYPANRRGVPLGVVGAVQELGSVLGPLYGAVVLSFGTWRDIFWINLAAGLVLAAAISSLSRTQEPDGPRRSTSRHAGDPVQNVSNHPLWRRLDWIGLLLMALTLTAMLLLMRQPRGLVTSVSLGGPFVPFSDGGSIWWSQIGVVTGALAVLLLAWLLLARRPLVDLRDWWGSVREADLVGAGLLSVALGGIILAFATADPEVQVFSPAGGWYLVLAAVAGTLFALHNRRSNAPLVPHGAFSQRSAWGALLVSFFVGAALIAALVDIPIFARITIADGSQIKAALVLVEFLVALPVGALVGGVLTRRMSAGAVAALGMLLASIGFWLMAGWSSESLHDLSSSAVLAMTGLGFGLALAPVNAALLASTDDSVHGVTSALLVVARMVGMLVGISALTTIGLRRYYAVQSGIPSPNDVCSNGRTRCAAYTRMIEEAGIEQLHAIFLGAALCAAVAGIAAILCFRGASTQGVTPDRTMRGTG
jgi:MFS family permease